MRARAMFGLIPRSASSGAVVLLALLLGHLILMSSPVHEAMRAEGAAQPAVAHGAPHALRVVSETAAHDAHDARGSDCALMWVTANQGFNTASLLPVATVGVTGEIDLQRSTPRMPHVIGPPMRGDAQALLQVFRL